MWARMTTNRIATAIGLLLTALISISWGTTGHFAAGRIAERHLTPAAANAVKDLLGGASLADVSTWADDIRGDEQYKGTDKWHYINLPGGISTLQQFASTVNSLKGDNVYTAVLKCRETLRMTGATRSQKADALRFLVHLVEDLHQPMHVSHAEDRGGNSIAVEYRSAKSNLHTVWDSKLIDDQMMGYEKIANRYDDVAQPQIETWQKDSVLQWIWESYQASEILYAEVAKPGGRVMKRAYYKAHIPIVRNRITMSGMRLAGMLNDIFGEGYVMPPADGTAAEPTPAAVEIDQVKEHIGEYATVCARVHGHKDLDDIKLVNLGAAYPNHLMTMVLKGRALKEVRRINGRRICVTGKIINYKGTPEIVVTDPAKVVRAGKK